MKNMNVYHPDLPESLNYPEVPVGALLKGARQFGTREAYIFRGKSMSFEQVYRESLRFANALSKLGVDKGTVAASYLPTCPQNIIAYYGIILTGAAFTPINPLMPTSDLLYQLNDSGTEVIVTYETLTDTVESILEGTDIKSVIVTGEQEIMSTANPIDVTYYGPDWYSFAELISFGEEKELQVNINPKEDIVHIGYTGGTTGKPKGAQLTHWNMVCNILQNAAWSAGLLPKMEEDGALTVERMEKNDELYLKQYTAIPGKGVRLSPSPLFHNSGVIGSIIYPMLTGTTTILIERFEVGKFLSMLEEYKVTEMAGAPTLFNFMLNHPDIKKRDYSSVRVINSGAAPIVHEVMKQLHQYFPNAIVTEGYGLTESTSTVTSTTFLRSGKQKLESVGMPVYDTELKIIPIDGNPDESFPPNQAGEVCVRGPQIMKSYLNKEEETAKSLVNGWFHTGDIGYLDEDGFLYIVDRKKEMLIYNGYNVYPKKLENLLYQHDDVASAIVIGKPMKDKGEIPKAFVVLKQNAEVTEIELMDFVNEEVVHYYKVRELEFIDEIPMSAAGKFLKRSLRDQEIKKSQQ